MATLFITEFASMAGAYPAPQTPPLAEQHVQIGGASVTSAAFNAATTFIMVSGDAPACLAFGTAPVADPLAHRMPADTTRYYGVYKSVGFKLAVIAPT